MNLLLNKVPQISLTFWIIKILCTTVGETGADYLTVDAGLGTAWTGAVMGSLLLLSLWLQVRRDRYIPWLYWLTVVLLSIVGTQVTDVITDRLEISLYVSTAVFAVLLAILFAIWHQKESTLSIDSITTRRRELFYWAAIFLTFALGTAAGDLATEALGLGFRLGAVIFGLLIAAIWLNYLFNGAAVLSFWMAYILTRPLGAAVGDFLSQSVEYGGLGWGTIYTSLVFLAVITLLVLKISVPSQSEAKEISE